MAKIYTLLLMLLCVWSVSSRQRTILLSGASFATPANGWFEAGCQSLDAIPINKAVGGESIYHTARKMMDESFYSLQELETIDAFVIMHVHNQNVFDGGEVKDNYKDYISFDSYTACFDYVIKRYKADCYNLRFEPSSKYYNTENGKPAILILTTHWHDSRTVYNSTVRKLAEKWDLPLIEFDKNIGFTKDIPDEDGNQLSLKYAQDTEMIDGVKYGWHPIEGKNSYIQQKMAGIFVEEIQKVFLNSGININTGEEKQWLYVSSDKSYLNVKNSINCEISIFAVDGKLKYRSKIVNDDSLINIGYYRPGIYIIQRKVDNKVSIQKIVK